MPFSFQGCRSKNNIKKTPKYSTVRINQAVQKFSSAVPKTIIVDLNL